MSKWQMFSDAGNSFRWEISDQHLRIKPDGDPIGSPSYQGHRLPSMADLLLQGCSELLENHNICVESPPMFRTGLGKSVMVSQSSISKALSILGDEGDGFADTGQLFDGRENGSNLASAMFQTGSGRMVNISSAGLVRAKTLLDLEEVFRPENLLGVEQTRNQAAAGDSIHWENSSHTRTGAEEENTAFEDAASVPVASFAFKTSSEGGDSKSEAAADIMQSASKPPPIKFQTAGGRSLSVSSDALQRARSLLGDPDLGTFLNEGDANDAVFPFDNCLIKENNPHNTLSDVKTSKSEHFPKSFVSPLQSSNRMQLSVMSENANLGNDLIKKFDAEEHHSGCRLFESIPCLLKPLNNRPRAAHAEIGNFLTNGVGSRNSLQGRASGRPLTDISNCTSMDYRDKLRTGEKRVLGRRTSISPFKKPRSSRFITPLNSNVSLLPNGSSALAPGKSSCNRRVSSRYPTQVVRTYIKEYFGVPPSYQNRLEPLPDQIRMMNPENAEKYMFCDGSGLDCIGAEAFQNLLAHAGASMQYASKKWVANHYKWVVWKLACYERSYPTKYSGKFLTVSNVLEELKYRYEREVNYGHRSAIKRLLEGDMPSSSVMVFCISSIYSNCDLKIESHPHLSSNGAESNASTKIELTDGWYAVDAFLDGLLSKKLAAGKLFVGQKLRIWGAGLRGWVGPVSPLEAPGTVSLLLHINGTYRAHWADRLGVCKGYFVPLAFRCIKSMGGPVPRTLVGVTRIYPVLYRERLSNGKFIVRSERMEANMRQLYDQRCSVVAEGTMLEFQSENKNFNTGNDHDSEEGARILKILETAAEPEVLMAEMSSEQLTFFAAYQAKQEAVRQSDMQKSIEKALEDAGLSKREVTAFMRVRVVGLTSKKNPQKCCPRKGLVTIWNPIEKQQSELVEGQAYTIAGLTPSSSDSDTLHLQASGSTTQWLPLSPSKIKHFEQFFCPRKPMLLSNMGEIPLCGEFDTVALVVYVGEVYTTSHQKKQWVFVTDGSIPELGSEDSANCLLAISFCSQYIDCDSFSPFSHNLVGSTVGFCNLIRKANDQINHLSVAEATENSTYYLSYDHAQCSHLKEAAASTKIWATMSSSKIEKLKEKVLTMIGDCGG